jgi:signal transduction histidine kinase
MTNAKQLTREELLTHYSEFAQEIAQPLTVCTGVLELFNSGRAGDLPESQRELLKMAAESLTRVNTLVEHLSAISGVPTTLAPNAQLLEKIYQN